ncbi:MAG: hypothetical protein ABIH50_01910 [bacterium]
MLAIGVVLCLILQALGVIGFAYIIYVLANKEVGIVKLAGQAIAAAIVLMVLLVAILGAPKANLVKRFCLEAGRSVVR